MATADKKIVPATFVDETSGHLLDTNRYYILSDDGTPYTEHGFASIVEAQQWWAVSDWVSAGDPVVPVMTEDGTGFEPVDSVNIFFGADLWVHYERIAATPLPTISESFVNPAEEFAPLETSEGLRMKSMMSDMLKFERNF